MSAYAEVESTTTYYAVCPRCDWLGNEHVGTRDRAEEDASAHKCDDLERVEFQAALDRAAGVT